MLQTSPVIDSVDPAGQYAIKPRRRKVWFGCLLFAVLCVAVFLMTKPPGARSVTVDLSDFRAQLANGNVAAVSIEGDSLAGQFRQPMVVPSYPSPILSFRTDLPSGMGNNWAFTEWLLENSNGAAVRVNNSQSLLMSILVPLIPWVLVFGFVWFFVFRQMRSQGKKTVEAVPVFIVDTPPAKE